MARFLKCVAAVLLAVACEIWFVQPICGQIVNARLYGSVADASGSAIPEATLTATDQKTGVATTTKADAAGSYSFPSLAPGTYRLAAEKSGFKSEVISGITLLVNQQAQVDVTLQVGQVTTQVEVTGATQLVETSTASVGTVIGERQVIDLPLNLRRLTSLATLVPGTVAASTFGYAAYIVGGSPFSEATYVSGGGRDSSNTLLVDGMESRAYDTGGFALAPPPDAVQEFKIQTNIYSAAFGKTAGSTMNVVTKSGGNEFHGDAYEFLRNDKLDARNFFATDQTNPLTNAEIPNSARPEYRRNQFGVTGGGPIRKNKTFIFGFYDALREVKGLSLTNIVPTDAQRQGNFSNVLTGQTVNLCGTNGPANLNFDSGQLFDPATESLFTCPSSNGQPGPTVLVGSPVPGNVISNIDPVGQKVLSGFPEPNRPGLPNYVNQTPRVRGDNQFGLRIDNNLGSKDRLFGRYLFAQSSITDPSAGYTSLPTFGDTIFFRGQNVAVGWTHSFGAAVLNEAQIGFQRNNPVENCIGCNSSSGELAGFGIKGLKPLGPQLEGFPFFGFSNFSGVGDAGYRPISNVEMTEDYRDNVTWTRGRHTIVAGADLQWLQNLRQQNPYSPRGQFSFNGEFSSLAGEIGGVSGVSDLADLLLGYPSGASRSLGYEDVNQVGSTFWSFYGQDDIRISPNLSLNIGLRYEYRRPPVDKRDNIVSFIPLGPKFSGPGNAALVTATSDSINDSLCSDPAHSNLISATGSCLVLTSAQRSQMGFTGRTRRTLIYPDRKDFGPRIGLTWRPTSSDRFVIRSGYGIFYDLANLNTEEFVSGNPIFGPSQVYNTAFGAPPPLTNGAPTTSANVFASGVAPLLNAQYAALWLVPNFVTPRVQEWSFGTESQLSQDWALDVGYVGSNANHLDNYHFFANQPAPGVGPLQGRRPYPDFNQLAYFGSDNNANYHSLQVKLTKRFSRGFLILTSYTYGKSMSDGEGNEGNFGSAQTPQDDNNPGPNYARAVSDVRHHLVYSGVWQLPVGKGQHFMDRGGVLNAVLGQWQASGILTLQSGFPFSVRSPQDFANTNSTDPMPDRVCNGAGSKTVAQWFDTSCFTIDALSAALTAGTPRFGNSGRNILTGPSHQTLDFAIYKNFALGERFKLEFRAEGFNVFNRANFGLPASTVGTSNYGQLSSAGDPRDIQFGLKLVY